MPVAAYQSAVDNGAISVITLDIAFVALVLPFDSFRGLREQTRSLFFRARGNLEV